MNEGKQSGGQRAQVGENSASASQEHRSPSMAEWVVGALATLLILGGIGFLVYQALTRPSLPPAITVDVKRILPQKGGAYAVEFVARNRGGMTARGLTIEGRLLEIVSGKEVEKSSTTLTWVPAHAERQGGLFFGHHPEHYRLEIGATGYERP